MPDSKIGFRIVAVVVLGAGSWFGCSSQDESERGTEVVATARQALDPSWTVDGNLHPVAWYVATASDIDKDSATNEISKWREHRGNGLDLTQSFGPGKPHFVADGWNASHATVRFDGGDLLSRSSWSLAPVGADQAFSILAVLRSNSQTQNGAVAGWWGPEGQGYVWAYLKASNGQLLPELMRTHSLSSAQMYTGPHDLGSGTNRRHVVAWRYSPSNHSMKVTLDGTTTSSSSMPAIGPLTSMPFIVGAKSLLPTGLFQGDISELVITNTTLTDAEVQNFTEYARINWGSDLPAQGSADPCVNADGSFTPVELEVRCDDGDVDTVGDRCAFGSCIGEAPLAGSPKSFLPGPVAWYHAGRSEVTITDDRVARWFDRTSNHRDLLQGFYNARPSLELSGWQSTPQNKPSIHFSGGQLMRDDAWGGAATGDDGEFSVLAVMRSEEDRNVGVASWWNANGAGRVSCQLKNAGSGCFPELYRSDDNAATQTFADSSDPNMDLQTTQHVVAWRFTPEVARLTLDGVTREVTHTASLGPITPASFLVGIATDFAPVLLKGHIAELAVIPRSLTDAELRSFRTYAQQEWGGLPRCDPNAPFGPISTVLAGNPTADGLTLSADELTAYVSRKESTNYDIYLATRSSPTGEFVLSPNPLPNVNGPGDDRAPWLSRDGQRLYFWKRTTLTSNGNLVMSSFSGGQFGAPSEAPFQDLNSNVSDEDPFLSEDENTLYFVSDRPTGDRDLWMSTRPASPPNSPFLPPTKLAVVNTLDDWAEERRPLLTPDQLTLYFHSDREGGNGDFDGDIFIARRTSTTQASGAPQDFGAPTLVDGLNSSSRDFPVALSKDSCTLYFASNRDTGGGISSPFKLYRASRCVPSCDVTACGSADGCGGTCPCGPGDDCSETSECEPGLVCVEGTCQCIPQCSAPGCGYLDGCGGTCACPPPTCGSGGQCETGEEGCHQDGDCPTDNVCVDGICKLKICLINARLGGCGFPGAPCGPCTTRPTCESDADCPSGYVCPEENGRRHGAPGERVCEKPECATDPMATGCGGPGSECGECSCTPNCAGKQCGDADLSDGCGGTCTGVCAGDGAEPGCRKDADCTPGNVCRSSLCLPADPCGLPNVAPPYCGTSASLCGPCPSTIDRFKGDRECGPDPDTGVLLATCGAERFCTQAGHCAPLETTLPIQVPGRTVEPVPSPPAVGIGSIPGAFAVSNRGKATYQVMLEVPPGRASIQPLLSLDYSSSSSNGALGIGWSLGGLSSITRCQRTFATDGYSQPVLGNDKDAFCLDGQRLVRLDSEYHRFEYRTLPDSFTKVVGVQPDSLAPEPEYFVAYTKDGRIITYGQSASSRSLLRTDAKFVPWSDRPGGFVLSVPIVGTWAATREDDRDGNYMTIEYEQIKRFAPSESTAEMLPKYISYTGHGALKGDREVTFTYSDGARTDTLFGYRAGGGTLSRSRRLEGIDIRAQGNLIRHYGLTYEDTLASSRLKSLVQCVGPTSATCLPPTTFNYIDDVSGFEPGTDVVVGFPSGETNHTTTNGIVYRGGNHDYLTTLSTSTYVTTVSPYFASVGFVASFVPGVGSYVDMALNILGQALDSDETVLKAWRLDLLDNEATGPEIPCDGTYIPQRQVIADPTSGHETLRNVCPAIKHSTIEYEPPPCPEEGPCPPPPSQPLNIVYYPEQWFVDIDGDGAQDMLSCSGDEQHIAVRYAKTDNPTSPQVPTTDTTVTKEFPTFGSVCSHTCYPSLFEGNDPAYPVWCNADSQFSTLVDVNGDGTSELVAYDRKLGWAALTVDFTVDPDGEFSWHPELFSGISIDPNEKYFTAMMDANGDGLRDILALPAAGTIGRSPLIAYNTGAGFVQQNLTTTSDLAYATTFPPFVVDLDHDGVEELIAPPDSKWLEAPEAWRLRRVTADGQLVAEDVPSLVAGPGIMGDFNGDGLLDAFTRFAQPPPFGNVEPFKMHHGTGRRHGLLKEIIDGAGRRVDIEYNGTGGIKVPDRSDLMKSLDGEQEALCRWPLRCNMKWRETLVTSHVESFYADAARTNLVPERQYQYWYADSFIDTAGYGSLGFAGRETRVFDRNGDFLRDTSVLFELPPPAAPAPYVAGYAKTGMTKLVIDVHPTAASTLADGSGGFGLEENTTNTWQVMNAHGGVPFVYLADRKVVTRDTSGFGGNLYQTTDVNTVDWFGNITSTIRTTSDLAGSVPHFGSDTIVKTVNTFEPDGDDIADWRIAELRARDTTSIPRCFNTAECDAKTQFRHEEFVHDPDSGKLVTLKREPGGDPKLDRTVTLVRDDRGNVTSSTTTDTLGNVRELSVTYDSRGLFPTSVTLLGEAIPQTIQARYDDRFGIVSTLVDANGIDWTHTLDDLGMTRHETGPDGETTLDYAPQGTYLAEGRVILAAFRLSRSVAGGESAIEDYNLHGQLVRAVVSGLDATSVAQEYFYDHRQRLEVQTRPHLPGDLSQGFLTYSYDERDQLTQILDADGTTTTYDRASVLGLGSGPSVPLPSGAQFVSTVTDAREKTTFVVSNRNGQPLYVMDGVGQNTTYAYGAFDRLARIEQYGNLAQEVAYDAYGRVLSVLDPQRGAVAETKTYDALDQLVATNDALGRLREIFYDNLGRVERTEDVDGATHWTYDGDGSRPNEIGRVVSTLGPTGQITEYRYQVPEAGRNRGLLSQVTRHVTDGNGVVQDLTFDYHYDDFSRISQVDYPQSAGTRLGVAYGYDGSGHQIDVHDAANPSHVHWALLEADQGYRIGRERVGSAPCSGSQGTLTEYQYDPLRDVRTNINTKCGSTVLQDIDYGYDENLNVASKTNHVSGVMETYGYDSINRLTHVDGEQRYVYAAVFDQLDSREGFGSYTYTDAEGASSGRWVATAGPNSYQHDAVGNISQRTGALVPGNTQTITYTQFDLPKSIETGGLPDTTFGYDAAGARVLKQAGDTATSYAGSSFRRTKQGSTTTDRQFVHVGNRAVAQMTRENSPGSTPTLRYLYDDLLGSAETITGADGSVQGRRNYSHFGMASEPNALATEVPLGFTGHEEDTELGLVNMKGRMYDPVLGQFLTADPIVVQPYSQGLNRFAYVNNSPLSNTDPSGFTSRALTAEELFIPGEGYGYEFSAESIVGTAPPSSDAPIACMESLPTVTSVSPPEYSTAESSEASDLADTFDDIGTGVKIAKGMLDMALGKVPGTEQTDSNVAISRGAASNPGNSPQRSHAGDKDWAPDTGPAPSMVSRGYQQIQDVANRVKKNYWAELGKLIHKPIQARYIARHPTAMADKWSSTIAAIAGTGPVNNPRARPDLFDPGYMPASNPLYEIKPDGQELKAQQEARDYITNLESGGVKVHLGLDHGPEGLGTMGTVDVLHFSVRYWSPMPGVIVYRATNKLDPLYILSGAGAGAAASSGAARTLALEMMLRLAL
jgi:RHS repeat-associated protein